LLLPATLTRRGTGDPALSAKKSLSGCRGGGAGACPRGQAARLLRQGQVWDFSRGPPIGQVAHSHWSGGPYSPVRGCLGGPPGAWYGARRGVGQKEAAGLPLGPGRRKAEVGPCPFGQRTASRRAATPLHYGGRGALCALVIRPIFRRPLKGGFLMPLSRVGEHHQPSLLPLFTGVRGRVVLGTSPTSGSRKSSVHRTGATRRRWPEGCNGDRCRGGANGNGENKARGRHRHGLLCPHGLVPALIVREVRTFLARRPDPDAREVFFGTRGRIRSVAGYRRQGQPRCEAGAQSPRDLRRKSPFSANLEPPEARERTTRPSPTRS
jgi:hypothetical protein